MNRHPILQGNHSKITAVQFGHFHHGLALSREPRATAFGS